MRHPASGYVQGINDLVTPFFIVFLSYYICEYTTTGNCGTALKVVVPRGQTLFRTKGKSLGFGHKTVCRPTPWSAYQSQHSIQSHDAWSMWLMGKFKISVWVDREFEAWEMRWARSVLSHELEHSRNWNCGCRKVASLTSAIAMVMSWLDLC